jgi:hypothetical protein
VCVTCDGTLQGEPYNKPFPTDEDERERLIHWMINRDLMEKEGWQQKHCIAWSVAVIFLYLYACECVNMETRWLQKCCIAWSVAVMFVAATLRQRVQCTCLCVCVCYVRVCMCVCVCVYIYIYIYIYTSYRSLPLTKQSISESR